MIFVTLGTCPFQFKRLVELADKYANNSGENVFIQTGYTKHKPKYCKYKNFMNKNEYIKLIKQAEVIIAHAGIGVSLDVLKLGKKLILVPRSCDYGEHTDNHQHELARILAKQGRVLLFKDRDDIVSLIKKAVSYNFTNKNPSKDLLVNKLSDYIKQLGYQVV